MGGGERAIRQQPGVENRGFHPFRAGHHSVFDVPGDDGRHVHERARPGVQDRPFLAVGSDIGQPHGPRKDIVEIGRYRIRNVDGVPLGEDAPGGEVQHLFPRRIQIAYARRLHQHGLLVIHGSPPRRPKRLQVKCAGTRTLRQYFCASCGGVSFVRYRRIVIRVGGQGARRHLSSLHTDGIKKMAGNTEGSVGAACAEKGTEGGYRSHVPSSSSLASRVSGKTSRRPMCFTSNFLFRAAKWRSP